MTKYVFMPGRLLLTFFLLLIAYVSEAQIMPKEGSVLNYRLAGFSSPEAGNNVIEVADGNYYSEDSFKKNIVKTFHCNGGKIIGEVPFWGRNYTWRARMPAMAKSAFHHFSTGYIPELDSNHIRLRIIKPALKYKDTYVFLDGNRVLYDMKGHPVWYLPNISGLVAAHITIRDLKLTCKGTITFIAGSTTNGKICEVNYNGDILWKGPDKGVVSKDDQENYHHQFTRLDNGHYMVLGSEQFSFHVPASPDSPAVVFYNDTARQYRSDKNYKEIPFGTIIEYDARGNIIWSWKSSAYFENSDLIYRKAPRNLANLEVHDNAFFFDEKNKNIYLSFKNISRIIKIKYPEGIVTEVYGEQYRPGKPETGNGQFCGQHSVIRAAQGYLYFLNNNACITGTPPKIMVMQEPVAKNGKLKTIWEYDCNIEGVNTNKEVKHDFEFSGNVIELPDHSFFASMTGTESPVFIVGRDKKILWSAALESLDEGKWYPVSKYRADIITDHRQLERLVWNTETKK